MELHPGDVVDLVHTSRPYMYVVVAVDGSKVRCLQLVSESSTSSPGDVWEAPAEIIVRGLESGAMILLTNRSP